jgi:hypothetical protein
MINTGHVFALLMSYELFFSLVIVYTDIFIAGATYLSSGRRMFTNNENTSQSLPDAPDKTARPGFWRIVRERARVRC